MGRPATFVLAVLLALATRLPAQLVNLAPAGTASQSSVYGGAFPGSLAIDLNFGNFTATGPDDFDPTWQVDLGDAADVRKIILHNRGDGCCPERLRDITVSILEAPGGAEAFVSDLLNPANALGGPAEIEVDLVALTGGGVEGRVVVVKRTPDPLAGGDDAVVLSLGEVEVLVADAQVPVIIRTQPLGGRAEVGTSFEFTVVATGPDPLSYKWKKGTDEIGGAAGPSLLLQGLKLEDSGSYTVLVSGGGQSVESDPAELVVTRTNLARRGLALQSTDYPGPLFPAALAIDGIYDDFTATAPEDTAPTWEVDLGGAVKIDEVLLFNRVDCCRSRLRDILVSLHEVSLLVDPLAVPLYESELLNEENILGGGGTDGPEELAVTISPAVAARFVRISRIPDDDLSGTGGQGGPHEVSILSLAEVEVHGDASGSCPLPGDADHGDTRCLGLQVDGPPEGGLGLYTASADAFDATGDEPIYTFTAEDGFTAPLVIGPVNAGSADFDLKWAANWKFSVTVDDNLVCSDVAGEATCTRTVEVAAPEGPNKALGRPARQSSEFGGLYPASLAVDGIGGDFTVTSPADPDPTWEVDLLGDVAILEILIYNRADCCPSRLRDITVSILEAAGGKPLFQSELLNPENVLGGGGLGGPAVLSVPVGELAGGPVTGRIVRIHRTPDPDLSGTGGQGNADEGGVLSLGEVEVYDAECGPGIARCEGIEVLAPEGSGPGTYTVLATATGDPIFYTFTADDGVNPPLVAGPQEVSTASFLLAPGTWTISVAVGDSRRCANTAAEATCKTDITVEALCTGTNLAQGATVSQSSDFGGFPAANAIDGDPVTFTATASTDAAPTWEADLGQARPIAAIVIHNRANCCPERLRDITVAILDESGTELEFQSDLLNPANTLLGPPYLVVDLEELTGGRVTGRFVRIGRTPDPWSSGEDASLLSIGEVEVCDGEIGPAKPTFRRGDVNGDGAGNITDPIFLLNFLFLGGIRPDCMEAADADDNGTAEIAGAIDILNFLFLGGPDTAPPGSVDCGPDPEGSPSSGCELHGSC